MFNNAGILLPDDLLTGDFERITATFDVNVFGPLRVARAFAPVLAPRTVAVKAALSGSVERLTFSAAR